MEVRSIGTVACVANRVSTRKLEREQKKKVGGGGGGVFLLLSQLSRRTRAETLATQAIGTAKLDISKTGYFPHPLPLPLRKNKEKQCCIACNTCTETDKLFWGALPWEVGRSKSIY